MNNRKSVNIIERDINVKSVKEKASVFMVNVNLIAKTVKVVKSVNIIERDMIVKSAVEKASVLTRDRELSVKIAEGHRSVLTADRSQDVKNASEPLLYFHNLSLVMKKHLLFIET